uniref:Putative ribonuclease H-like domain-containing protein n=1 Tax=Tanacetum cinerariifolium TaxID=118510 RepID=A0A699HNS5_TANCI|nr:putative ribonuclease H-like domain-containing protein [Tanacetum cinerariifolium]
MNYQPVAAGIQSNSNAGTKDNNEACKARKEKEPCKDYILLPLWTADLPFLQELKRSQDVGFKHYNDVGKKVNEVPRQENECKDQKENDSVNSTNRVNGYTQEEVIDYNEVFAPVAKIEAIRLFLAYASFKDFMVYQMDVKSVFLYGKIKEECKKQTVVANSTTEAEYVAASSCCGQVLWI